MSRRRRERGVALLLVLWVFMVLGVIALDFARYMRDDAMAAINLADESRGYYIALAGMNRVLFDAERLREVTGAATARAGRQGGAEERLEEDAPLVPPDGQWHEGEFAGGRWAVRVTDECGRISLNRVDEVTLKEVITNLVLGGNRSEGVDRRMEMQLDTVVDSIIDWRDVDDLKGAHGAETEYYMNRRVPHPAKNGYFDTPEELLKVRGVTPALFYGNGDCAPGLRDVFSVYCRKKSVNLHTAPAAVFQVVLGVDCDGARELVAQRDAGAPLPIVQQGGPGSSGPFSDDPPKVVLIEARGDLTEERNQSRVAAVVQLESDVTEGVRILRWLDRAPWTGGLPRDDAGAGGAPS